MNGTNANGRIGRIEALKERERQIRAAIAAEQIKRAKREKRDAEKLFRIVGEALVRNAAQSPESHAMLRQTLGIAVTEESDRNFLHARGWLQD